MQIELRTRILLLSAFLLSFCSSPLLRAQSPAPSLSGDYVGMLGQLHLKLHLQAEPSGALSGTLDSPDQGALGIRCSDIKLEASSLRFTVPAVHGSWQGTVSPNARSLTGTWTQGAPMPLNLTRDDFQAADKPSPIDGIWLGTLKAGGAALRIQLHLKSDKGGQEYCSIDSLDQRAMGLECADVKFVEKNLSFTVPSVRGNWSGTLSEDGNALAGTWSQGAPMQLEFTRRTSAAVAAPPPSYDPAVAPLGAAELKPVLDRDLIQALQSGELAPSTGTGIAIGVIEHGIRKVFSYGTAQPDSIFEIGSVTKTFTGLILAQMEAQGKVKMVEPVRELLPPGTVTKPAGAEITLLDLATQHSGLPRMPDNFSPADPANPYADYRPANLYQFLSKHGVAIPSQAGFLYSNLGFGLLGQALAVRAGMSYPELLKQQVCDPLGLSDTTVALSPAQQARFIQGHNGNHDAAHAWDLDALAGAGAIRSTAADMLTYLEANLHPEKLQSSTKTPAAVTLSDALNRAHQLRADAFPGTRIALAWLFDPITGNYWHNGATGGYSSYVFFNPKADYAAVVLVNTTLDSHGSFADRLGEHVSERLAGKAAISLAP